jgi:GTP:adenosylcobinamide-phosphate guanylyltransferase
MDAIITAGGIPQPEELLYEVTQGQPKCIIQIYGKTMVQWVLDALAQAGAEHIVVMGLPADTPLSFPGDIHILQGKGGIIENIRAGAEELLKLNPTHRPMMVVSGDLPCVTSEMLKWAAEEAITHPCDFQYTVVPRNVMEEVFPGSKRSYVKAKGLEVCGGDVIVIDSQKALEDLPVMKKLAANRKNAFKQAAIMGFDLLFMMFMGWLSLEKAEKVVSHRLGINGKVLISPFAEVGMDVDKPVQLELVKTYFQNKYGG